MKGELLCAMAMSLPDGLNLTPLPNIKNPVGMPRFAYFVPKPEDQGYTEMQGKLCEVDDLCPTAMSLPDGLKATLAPLLVGTVAGSAYFVPKPEDQGYAEI